MKLRKRLDKHAPAKPLSTDRAGVTDEGYGTA